MMHIGYVLKVFPRLSQTFIVNELRAHQQAGCHITVFSLKKIKPCDLGLIDHRLKVPVHYLQSEPNGWGEELARLCEAHGISHLHAHFGNVAAATAREAARMAHIPYTFTAHAVDIFDDKVDQNDLRAKIADSAGLITVSQFNVNYLRSVFGRRSILVHNGLPLDEFPYRFNSGQEPLILAVGRLIPKKGFDCLIEACMILKARGIRFRTEIVGEGPLHHELLAAVTRAGVQDCVALIGAISPEDVHRRILAAALLAAPCRVAPSGDRDGLPTVLLEAMALGTPCVSTDVTGIPEVILHQQTGLVTRPDDAMGLADACQELLQDREHARHLSIQARALIEDRFDCHRTSQVLRRVWQKPPRRFVFRIHNRRGMGHWMRSANLARELLREESNSDIVFYSRVQPALPLDPEIRTIVADDCDELSFASPQITDFQPHLYIDDTILKGPTNDITGKRVLILRRLTNEKHDALMGSPEIRHVDLIIVPHTLEEFGHELPESLLERTHFVGPIVRSPDEASIARLRAKYVLADDEFVLVTTPGGGGFVEDAAQMFRVATEVHLRLQTPRLRHFVIRGPNAMLPLEPIDERMTVVNIEPDLVSLFSLSHFVVSAGGYNSVNEIRLVKKPAFFIPGVRKYDDQGQRVQDLLERGVALSSNRSHPREIAEQVVDAISDPTTLQQLAAGYKKDTFAVGNAKAAQLILACAHQ